MFQLIYELYFFLYYFLLSFFMIIDHNSIESFHNTSSITPSHSHRHSKNDIVIEVPENVYSKKNKDDINCTLLDLDYLENNYVLCDYKENLIEV